MEEVVDTTVKTEPGAPEDQGGKQPGQPQDEGTKEQQPRTFTQDELDRIITDRLAKERKRQDAERSEATRLAAMSAEERAKDEVKKQRESFEAERAKFEAERMEMETTKLLSKESLPVEFSGMLSGKTAEETTDNVAAFKTAFQAAVEAAVIERVRGSGMPRSAAGAPQEMSGVERAFLALNPKLKK